MDWDARYHAGEAPADEPHRLVIEAARMCSPGRALDLACGAGRNARYLAERGWRVTGADRSVAALRLVGLPQVVLADLERDALPFRTDFDLIIIINFMYRPLFAEAIRALRSGGILAAAIRTTGNYSLRQDEFRAQFHGCEIVVERGGEIIAIRNSAVSDRSASA